MALEKTHDHYAVSEDGRVWSYKTDKWLKPATTSNGYKSVRLNNKTQNLHRLVAEAFCDKPEGCNQVNHIDGDKTNNHASNLEWVTMSENHKHAYFTGIRKPSDVQREAVRKQGIKNRKFTMDEARFMRSMYNTYGFTQTAIAKLFETSSAVISLIVCNKTYQESI